MSCDQNCVQEKWAVPLGISNHHIHLSQEDLEALFGAGYELTNIKDLTQPGQYACKETLTVVGGKGTLQGVRILGPTRKDTQVELSQTDARQLGIKAPLRESGDVEGSPGCVLIGPKGPVVVKEGCIVAKTHVHFHTKDAQKLKIKDKEKIDLLVKGQKTIVLCDVVARVGDAMQLDLHLDTDEANAALVKNGDFAYIINRE